MNGAKVEWALSTPTSFFLPLRGDCESLRLVHVHWIVLSWTWDVCICFGPCGALCGHRELRSSLGGFVGVVVSDPRVGKVAVIPCQSLAQPDGVVWTIS